MAIKKSIKKLPFFDFSSWNFIIFLLLSLVLMAVVAVTLSGPAKDLSVQAGFMCPEITTLPRPEDCPGGRWAYGRDTHGCRRFECPTNNQPFPRPTDMTYPRPTGWIEPSEMARPSGMVRPSGYPRPTGWIKPNESPFPTGSSMRMRTPTNEPHVDGPSY